MDKILELIKCVKTPEGRRYYHGDFEADLIAVLENAWVDDSEDSEIDKFCDTLPEVEDLDKIVDNLVEGLTSLTSMSQLVTLTETAVTDIKKFSTVYNKAVVDKDKK